MFSRYISTIFLILSLLSPFAATAEEEYWEYTFRPGDSIWKIAEKYTNSVNNWSRIQEINEIRRGSDRRIHPGTRIVIPVSMLKQQPVPAIVIAVSGATRLIRADGTTEKPEIGTKLYSGDRILTGDRQNLRMQFADKSELQVLAGSEVILDKLSHHKQTGMVDTRIRLNTGSVNTWVKKQKTDSHYQIKTPAAITAVRGTSYRLSTDEHQVSRTEVTGGTVAVAAGDVERAVEDGYGIVAEKDKPLPKPVKLLSSPQVTIEQLTDSLAVRLMWKPLDGAKYYRYQVAADEAFNDIRLNDTTTATSVEVNDLQTGHYYLHVRGIDQYELGGVDSVDRFEIKAIPEKPPVEDDSYWKVIMSIGLLILIL